MSRLRARRRGCPARCTTRRRTPGPIPGTGRRVSGAGLARYRGRNQPCLWTAFLADYESRRWFFSYEPRFVWDGDIATSVWQRARIGVAPYLADYNQLNTWLMFQVDHHPAKRDHFVATPLLRFFYKTYLFEIGYGSNQHIMVNWQIQF